MYALFLMESFPQGCWKSQAHPQCNETEFPRLSTGLSLASRKLWKNLGEQGSTMEPCPGSLWTVTGPKALVDSAHLWKSSWSYPARTCEDSSGIY